MKNKVDEIVLFILFFYVFQEDKCTKHTSWAAYTKQVL